jgi:hypothetical protein
LLRDGFLSHYWTSKEIKTCYIDVVLWDPEKQKKKQVLISGRPLINQNDKVVAAVVTIKHQQRQTVGRRTQRNRIEVQTVDWF